MRTRAEPRVICPGSWSGKSTARILSYISALWSGTTLLRIVCTSISQPSETCAGYTQTTILVIEYKWLIHTRLINRARITMIVAVLKPFSGPTNPKNSAVRPFINFGSINAAHNFRIQPPCQHVNSPKGRWMLHVRARVKCTMYSVLLRRHSSEPHALKAFGGRTETIPMDTLVFVEANSKLKRSSIERRSRATYLTLTSKLP